MSGWTYSHSISFTYSDVWPECLNGICKTVLTQGNNLTIIVIISIPVTGKTDPRVTVPFYSTHTQNIQSKDLPCFKELTMHAHWKTVKTGSEKSLYLLPDLEEDVSFIETHAFRFFPDLIFSAVFKLEKANLYPFNEKQGKERSCYKHKPTKHKAAKIYRRKWRKLSRTWTFKSYSHKSYHLLPNPNTSCLHEDTWKTCGGRSKIPYIWYDFRYGIYG